MAARLFGTGPSCLPNISVCVEKSVGQSVGCVCAHAIAWASFVASKPTSAGDFLSHAPLGGQYAARDEAAAQPDNSDSAVRINDAAMRAREFLNTEIKCDARFMIGIVAFEFKVAVQVARKEYNRSQSRRA